MIDVKEPYGMVVQRFVQQPSPFTCVHACIAMITGEDVEGLVERFGNHALGWEEKACALIENGLFPIQLQDFKVLGFYTPGLYMLEVLSINQKGMTHAVVAEKHEDEWALYDPNMNREGVEYYNTDVLMKGELPIVSAWYVHKNAMASLRSFDGNDLHHEVEQNNFYNKLSMASVSDFFEWYNKAFKESADKPEYPPLEKYKLAIKRWLHEDLGFAWNPASYLLLDIQRAYPGEETNKEVLAVSCKCVESGALITAHLEVDWE